MVFTTGLRLDQTKKIQQLKVEDFVKSLSPVANTIVVPLVTLQFSFNLLTNLSIHLVFVFVIIAEFLSSFYLLKIFSTFRLSFSHHGQFLSSFYFVLTFFVMFQSMKLTLIHLKIKTYLVSYNCFQLVIIECLKKINE